MNLKYLKRVKGKSILVIYIALVISTILIGIHFLLNRATLNNSCVSHLFYNDSANRLNMRTNAIFIFKSDDRGMLTLDGNVTVEGVVYKLSRTITFDYRFFSQRTYLISNKKSVINKKDSLPQELFESKLFSGNTFYISSVDGVKNLILIGTQLSPVFMCVVS